MIGKAANLLEFLMTHTHE